jgi:hypothetical protein
MIEELSKLVPKPLRRLSGRVFYSGRTAFSARSEPLYVLGLNPGGDPLRERQTIEQHCKWVCGSAEDDWSAYRDECWGEGEGEPGQATMQKRVLHLLEQVDYPEDRVGWVPCSNLVFVRSSEEADLRGELNDLAEQCWRVHEHVIDLLKPRVVLCFGKTCGSFVRAKLAAHKQLGRFQERNERRWRSDWFAGDHGPAVVVATHPSRANWINRRSDPSGLVRQALGR